MYQIAIDVCENAWFSLTPLRSIDVYSFFSKCEMKNLMTTIIFIVVLYGYLWVKRRYRYWENRKIPHLKPESLFFGNSYDVATGRLSTAEGICKNYENLAPHRFGGVYHFHQPVLYIRDPELTKNILIKDFHHFHDRNFNFTNERHPLSSHVFNLVGEEWKELRQKLSPTFTSGKMKMLFVLMKECVEKLEKIIDESTLEQKTINAKDLMTR